MISVVIPSFRTPADRLAGLCRSLAAQTYGDFEVVVVSDGCPAAASPLPDDPRFRMVRSPSREGPAAARNLGVRLARGELLFFTDSDCELAPGALAAAVAALGDAPFVAGETVTRAGTRFGRLVACLGYPGGGSLGFDRVWRVGADGFTDSVSACNFAVRRAEFEELGGFDASIPVAGGEDTVLAKVALRHGHRIRFAPAQLVFHAERDGLAGFVAWQVTRGRGSFHIARRLGRLGGFLRLRLWSLGNGLAAAGPVRGTAVFALWLLLVAAQAVGYGLEKARARRAGEGLRLPMAVPQP